MTENTSTESLFPLNTVLFPGSLLQLKIFEQRYLDLVKTCMRDSHGFVVVLISEGREVDDIPKIHRIGTYVEITDFETLENGLLGITIRARDKVRISEPRARHDGLLRAEVDTLSEYNAGDNRLEAQHEHLSDVLESLVQHPLLSQQYADIDFASATEVSYRLSEFLPIANSIKQELLEIDDVVLRLDRISTLIEQLQQSQ